MDEGMMLNEGMFANEQGWVLKPEGYQSSTKTLVTQQLAAKGRVMTLTIVVYAGQHIPLSNAEDDDSSHGASKMRPFVKAELHVDKLEPAAKADHECVYKNRTEAGKTDHPNYGPDGARLHFNRITGVVEELSFLRIKVEDESLGVVSSPLLAWNCIRLDRLRAGFRFIHLRDRDGTPVPDAKLLVHITKSFK
jgi:hypothetical protein